MKILMWLNKSPDPVIAGFSRNPEYHYFFQILNRKHDFRFAYGLESHTGQGKFTNVYKYEKGRIIAAESSFVADVVYQFTRMDALKHNFGKAKILNTPVFRAWGSDKANQYELLKEFFPKTISANSIEDIEVAARQIGGSVILKPRMGQRGENVVYWDLAQPLHGLPIDTKKLNSSGYLVQEFADTSCGIPQIVNGTHDIKLVVIGNSVFANLRVPQPHNTHICTFESDYTEVKIEYLPQGITDFYSAIRTAIHEKYPKQIFTIDIGMTRGGPKLFEINTHTAFPYIHFEYAYDFIETFIKHLEQY